MSFTSTIHGLLVPHAPTLLEDEMDYKKNSVITALQDTGKKLKNWGVEAVIAVSTHWQTPEKFFIDNSAHHQTVTDYYGFRTEIEYDALGHPPLAKLLLEAGKQDLVYPAFGKQGVDHAITIPLHFMFPDKSVPVVPLSISQSPLCAFRWGRSIGHALRNSGKKVLFLASGSLAHDLSYFAANRQTLAHQAFDHEILELLAAGKGMDVTKLDPKLIALAKPEGNFRDLMMLLGTMGSATTGKVLAYEALPGIGLGVIEFTDTGCHEKDINLLH